MSELDLFTAARDSLLAARDDYDTAYRTFAWPEPEHFNCHHSAFRRSLRRLAKISKEPDCGSCAIAVRSRPTECTDFG